MAIAIIETGGKQYTVSPEQTIKIEKLDAEPGSAVIFDKVLLISDGKETKVGKPYLEGAQVQAKLIDQVKGDKVRIVKYKAKKRYRRTTGHRQKYSQVTIQEIKS